MYSRHTIVTKAPLNKSAREVFAGPFTQHGSRLLSRWARRQIQSGLDHAEISGGGTHLTGVIGRERGEESRWV
jgi:hypothetical protein